ncbi:MAG: Smr/MutS family protein [Bacteroidales bacterium]|nr:Smr/MutS family protein [Bacteroidales bacterium]
MIYPSNFEHKIGFNQIRNLIGDACISEMGRHFVSRMKFTNKKPLLEKWLNQCSELSFIISSGKSFPSQNYFDLREEFQRLKTPGTFIGQEALFDLKLSLATLSDILAFFNNSDENEFPELKVLTTSILFPEKLFQLAESIIDYKGEIKDTASTRLAEIRKELVSKQKKIMKETRKVFQHAKDSGLTVDKAEITIRNGRWVIPVKAADKRAFQGVIHDESATGQTIFIEPMVSFEINNELRELENEEHREIIKILTHFTDELRPFIDELNNAYRFLGLIDFIRAKAIFSNSINGHIPVLSDENILKLKRGVHPLLFLNHKKSGKEIVPLDLDLNPENRMIVISGPNAGGKSVCLKTVGLLQYMLQCGIPLSASPDSIFRLYENIFIDIGDEQSLENDLSTYSSHLLNMKHFIQHANENSLILIDEFGTGTEPQLGGAIAEAALEQFSHKKAYGVITTHYSNLKLAADRLNGLINGAMLFDVEELKPLYLLKTGQPGSSFAFEIAKKIGFPKSVIQRAQKKSGSQHLRFDIQLQQLEADKLSFSQQKKEVDEKEAQLNQLLQRYNELKDQIQQQKKEIIQQAKEEALNIVSQANKKVENTIREIKEAQAEKEKTKISREELNKTKKLLEKDIEKLKQPVQKQVKKRTNSSVEVQKTPESGPLKVGDYVQIKNTGSVGILLKTSDKESQVEVNGMKLTIATKNLEKTLKRPKKTGPKGSYSGIVQSLNDRANDFKLSLDLRGKRADEALELLQKYIDDAIMLGMKEVSILHGKGFGILRETLREYLLSVKEIDNFGDAPVDMGGAGITRIRFK